MSEEAQLARQLLGAAGLRMREKDLSAFSQWTVERARALGFTAPGQYASLLADHSVAGRREREQLTVRFTTGESYFFRDQGQIDLLAATILPQLIARRANERQLRIWSAGCAAGEEAYTLAILADEMADRLAGWKVLILATDINTQALEQARRGIYREWSFRSMVDLRKRHHFRAHGDRWQIEQRLRDRVQFSNLDLVHDHYPDRDAGICDFDLILCRNVFIYLDAHAAGLVVSKFSEALADGGFLMTGHNELFGHDTAPLRVHLYAQSAVFEKTVQPTAQAGLGEALVTVHVPATAALLPASAHLVQSPRIEQGALAAATQAPRIARRAVAIEAQSPQVERRTVAAPLPAAHSEDCDRLIESARQHADRGRTEAAAADCRNASAVAALDPRPYFLMAQLAFERGEPVEAKALLNKVIYLDSSFVAAYLELGALYAQDGEEERARRMYATVRAALARLAPQTVVAPFKESTAADILAYVERLLGTPGAIAAGSTCGGAKLMKCRA